MAARRAEELRNAAAALESGDFRGAIRLCEQIRALERVSEAELVRIFELLGRAYVGLGEHETALSFLKRADRNPATVAAAATAFEALGYAEDPTFFEAAEVRAKKKRRRRIVLVAASAVLLPIVLVCGGALYTMQRAYSVVDDLGAGYEAAMREGAERGRAGTVEDCVDHAMPEMVRCAGLIGSSTLDVGCMTYLVAYESCLSTTRWNDYCEGLPPPTIPRAPADEDGPPEVRTEPWAEAECASRVEAADLTGEPLAAFHATCNYYLSELLAQCADPSLRPALEELSGDVE